MKDTLIEFGLPAMVIVTCAVLLLCGVDGEVKGVLAMAAGWMFSSSHTRNKAIDAKSLALQSKSEGVV